MFVHRSYVILGEIGFGKRSFKTTLGEQPARVIKERGRARPDEKTGKGFHFFGGKGSVQPESVEPRCVESRSVQPRRVERRSVERRVVKRFRELCHSRVVYRYSDTGKVSIICILINCNTVFLFLGWENTRQRGYDEIRGLERFFNQFFEYGVEF